MLSSLAGTLAVPGAAMGLANGLDLFGTLFAACPMAPRPILPLPNAPNAALLAEAVLGAFPTGDEEGDVELVRSLSEGLFLKCWTPGRVGADQMSLALPGAEPALLLATSAPLPRGGDEVIQLEDDADMPAGLPMGADQVSLGPKMDDIVLELKGGNPPACARVAFAPGAELKPLEKPGAGPKLSRVGS